MLNSTTILGTLGRDSEVRSANGQFVISYSIASSLKWKDKSGEWKEKTYWTECDQWFKNEQGAKNLSEALLKGSKVIVIGLAYPRAWIKDGNEAMAQQCLRVDQLEIIHSTKQKEQRQYADMPPVSSDSQDDDDLPF